MKKTLVIVGLMALGTLSLNVSAQNNDNSGSTGKQMKQMMPPLESIDSRISLGLNPMMKQHQLANMRGHVLAIQQIVGLLAEKNFDQASEIAHNKLGLTPEMKKMCNMFENDDFKIMGLSFHNSADELGEVLKTGDMTRSLNALHTTMGLCVQCHATFRQ